MQGSLASKQVHLSLLHFLQLHTFEYSLGICLMPLIGSNSSLLCLKPKLVGLMILVDPKCNDVTIGYVA